MGPGKSVDSQPISINVERPDPPRRLETEPPGLSFRAIDGGAYISLYGFFADGSKVDLTHSTLTKYVSEDPRIATVDESAVVTPTGFGVTGIRISNGGSAVRVPVGVRKPDNP